ncbi:hypothetical protein EC890511_2191, partial [Escherichia coli 89.0511]
MADSSYLPQPSFPRPVTNAHPAPGFSPPDDAAHHVNRN